MFFTLILSTFLSFCIQAQDLSQHVLVELKSDRDQLPLRTFADMNDDGEVLFFGSGVIKPVVYLNQSFATVPTFVDGAQSLIAFGSGKKMVGSVFVQGVKKAAVWENLQTAPVVVHQSQGVSEGLAINSRGDVLIQELGRSEFIFKIVPSSRRSEDVVNVDLPSISTTINETVSNVLVSGLSNQGQVVGNIILNTGRTLPFFWSASTGAKVLPGFSGVALDGVATSIAVDGSIGGKLKVASGVFVPVIWQPTNHTPHRLFDQDFAGQVNALVDKNFAVGFFAVTPGQNQAFLYRNGNAVNLNNLAEKNPNLNFVEALDVNLNGVVALLLENQGRRTHGLLMFGPKVGVKFSQTSVLGGTAPIKVGLVSSKAVGANINYSLRTLRGSEVLEALSPMVLGASDLTFDRDLSTKAHLGPKPVRAIVTATPVNLLSPVQSMSAAGLEVDPLDLSLSISPQGGVVKGGVAMSFNTVIGEIDRIRTEQFGVLNVQLVSEPAGAVTFSRSSFQLSLGRSVGSPNRNPNLIGATSVGQTQRTPVVVKLVESGTNSELARGSFTIEPTLVSRARSSTQPKWNSTSLFVISLDGPAPRGGMRLNLSADDHNMFQVPATATVPEGRQEITLQVRSGIGSIPVDHNVNVTIRGPSNRIVQRVVVKPL